MDIFINIISGVAIASFSSWITVRLSLERFRTEKWWEKKAEAYSNLLGAIHDAKAFAEENLQALSRGRNLTDEEDVELRLRSKKSEADIYRSMDVGAFYFSQETLECLKKYKQASSEAGKDNDWILYLTEDFDSTDRCLKSMVEIARKDLKVKLWIL